MALFLFTDAIVNNKPIQVFNYGKHRRDFTFIDDITEGILRTLDHVAEPNPAWSGIKPDPGTSKAPWRVYNIGNSSPVELMDYIEALEGQLGRTAIKEFLPLQPGDVPDTCADVDQLMEDVHYKPETTVQEGIRRFVAWYREYYAFPV